MPTSRRPRWIATVLAVVAGLAASTVVPPGYGGDAAQAVDPVLRECAPGEGNTGRLTDVRLAPGPAYPTILADGWVRYCQPAPRTATTEDRLVLVAHGLWDQRPRASAAPYLYTFHQQVKRFRGLVIPPQSDMHHGCLHAGRRALHCWRITIRGDDGEPIIHEPSPELAVFDEVIHAIPTCGTCW